MTTFSEVPKVNPATEALSVTRDISTNKKKALDTTDVAESFRIRPQAVCDGAENHSVNGDLEGLSWDESLAKKVAITQEALSVPPGHKKSAWIKRVADSHGLDKSTVYRYLEKYREGKAQKLRHTKATKGRALAWSPDALHFWLGLVLKREHRNISKKSIYKALTIEADKRRWKIGSYQNACKQFSKYIEPQLVALQRGGVRALDNALPPVLRTYEDLQPFEIIVGDQHRFDFWVSDPETGEVFRPEGYLWQDLKTRAIYGAALARRYDSYLMAEALWVGVRQFGLFQSVYTDNGKPELSRYIEDIVKDVKGFNLSVRETISTAVDLSNVHTEDIQCQIRQPGEHIKAIVRNAKAKMIEGTFNFLEEALRNQGLIPGYAKKLRDLKEYQDVDEKQLGRLAESGNLLTFEEFYNGLFLASGWYNFEKHHRGLLREAPLPKPKTITPMACLERCIRDGWRPTRIPEEQIDLLFLPKEQSPRTVDRGRIQFRNALYEHPKLNRLTGQKVTLRFNPQDPGYVLVFYKGEPLCKAETVEYSSMKDKLLAQRKIKEKAHFRKEIVNKYRQLTSGIPDIRQFSTVPKLERTAALIEGDKRKKAIENEEMYHERTKEELALEVLKLKKVAEVSQHKPEIDTGQTKRPAFFLNDLSRYKWILGELVESRHIPREDQEFKENYEAQMEPEKLEYWQRRQEFKEVGSC